MRAQAQISCARICFNIATTENGKRKEKRASESEEERRERLRTELEEQQSHELLEKNNLNEESDT